MIRAATLVRTTYARYLGASVAALALDFAAFLALLSAGVPAALASGLAYAGGVAAHWWLSSRAVFDGVCPGGSARLAQQALFLISAGVGLALTVGIVGLGAALGLDPRLGKLAAVAVSFQSVWWLRRHIVFAR